MSDDITLYPSGFFEIRAHYRDLQPIVMMPAKADEDLCVMLPQVAVDHLRTHWVEPQNRRRSPRNMSRERSSAAIWLEL